jgi:hypothetical protein
MLTVSEKILKLYKQLFPTGRAFRLFSDSNRERKFKVLSTTNGKVYKDIVSTFDSMFPDNVNFTVNDTTDWERRLGINANPLTSLSDRKLAISRKMAAPGVNPARSSALWMEYELRAAGFNVYVHENILRDDPATYDVGIFNTLQLGEKELGNLQLGKYYNYIVANSLINDVDVSNFNWITNFANCFFIGGLNFGDYANVPTVREQEFRTLILSLKQTQNVCFAYINFY